jgi:hypothetical protein
MYFECHITLGPMSKNQKKILPDIIALHGFRCADLKETSKAKKIILTSNDVHDLKLENRMRRMIGALKHGKYPIARYKIEEITLDSKKEDIYGWVDKPVRHSPIKKWWKFW